MVSTVPHSKDGFDLRVGQVPLCVGVACSPGVHGFPLSTSKDIACQVNW